MIWTRIPGVRYLTPCILRLIFCIRYIVRDTTTTSHLTVSSARYSDTGLVSCRYLVRYRHQVSSYHIHYRYIQHPASVSTVYLYVEDTDHLFILPDHLVRVNIHLSSATPTNIGCQPATPRAELSIINYSQHDITNTLQDNLMEFSNQTGLWVMKGKLHYHTGLLTCQLELGNKKQTQFLYLNLLGEHEVTLPSPRLPVTPLTPSIVKGPVSGSQ